MTRGQTLSLAGGELFPGQERLETSRKLDTAQQQEQGGFLTLRAKLRRSASVGAARTVAVPANATRRARHRCVSLMAAAWFGLISLDVCVCLALSLNVTDE